MKQMECGPPSARLYCRRHPGLCCAVCPFQEGCAQICLNSPERCGYAGQPGYGSYTQARAGKEVPHGG